MPTRQLIKTQQEVKIHINHPPHPTELQEFGREHSSLPKVVAGLRLLVVFGDILDVHWSVIYDGRTCGRR